MSDLPAPDGAIWETILDLQNEQRAATAGAEEDVANVSIANAYAFAALAEASIETGAIDRERLVDWLRLAAEHSEAHGSNPSVPDFLGRLRELVGNASLMRYGDDETASS